MAVIITANSNEPEWVLTSVGLVARIKEIASEYGVTVLDASTGHSNLPTVFHISTNEGISDLRITATTAVEVEKIIRDHFNHGDSEEVIEPDPEPVFKPAEELKEEVVEVKEVKRGK